MTTTRLPAPEPHGLTPARSRVVASTALAIAVGVTVTALRSLRIVQGLRRRAGLVPPLDLALELSGDWPHRKVAVLGDSAAAGHGLAMADQTYARQVARALHAADGRATTVRTVAVDGATTAAVVATQLDAVGDAEVVIIAVGVNDAFRGRRVSDVREDLARLLSGVGDRASSGAAVVLLACPDLSAAPGLPRELRAMVGWRCRAIAAMQSEVAARFGVPVVAADRSVMTAAVFGDDGVHPGVAGHRAVAERLVRHLTG